LDVYNAFLGLDTATQILLLSRLSVAPAIQRSVTRRLHHNLLTAFNYTSVPEGFADFQANGVNVEQLIHVAALVETNAFPLEHANDKLGIGLFDVEGRLRHSETPNCFTTWNSNIQRLTTHAMRDLAAGEEIVIEFKAPPGVDVRVYVRQWWGGGLPIVDGRVVPEAEDNDMETEPTKMPPPAVPDDRHPWCDNSLFTQLQSIEWKEQDIRAVVFAQTVGEENALRGTQYRDGGSLKDIHAIERVLRYDQKLHFEQQLWKHEHLNTPTPPMPKELWVPVLGHYFNIAGHPQALREMFLMNDIQAERHLSKTLHCPMKRLGPTPESERWQQKQDLRQKIRQLKDLRRRDPRHQDLCNELLGKAYGRLRKLKEKQFEKLNEKMKNIPGSLAQTVRLKVEMDRRRAELLPFKRRSYEIPEMTEEEKAAIMEYYWETLRREKREREAKERIAAMMGIRLAGPEALADGGIARAGDDISAMDIDPQDLDRSASAAGGIAKVPSSQVMSLVKGVNTVLSQLLLTRSR